MNRPLSPLSSPLAMMIALAAFAASPAGAQSAGGSLVAPGSIEYTVGVEAGIEGLFGEEPQEVTVTPYVGTGLKIGGVDVGLEFGAEMTLLEEYSFDGLYLAIAPEAEIEFSKSLELEWSVEATYTLGIDEQEISHEIEVEPELVFEYDLNDDIELAAGAELDGVFEIAEGEVEKELSIEPGLTFQVSDYCATLSLPMDLVPEAETFVKLTLAAEFGDLEAEAYLDYAIDPESLLDDVGFSVEFPLGGFCLEGELELAGFDEEIVGELTLGLSYTF